MKQIGVGVYRYTGKVWNPKEAQEPEGGAGMMTKAQKKREVRGCHIERHKELHRKLDELVAGFIRHTGSLPSKTTLMEFREWSYRQTISPDEVRE